MKNYHFDEHEETITIEIGKSVALVLDYLLDRWTRAEDDTIVKIEHDAEWHSLSMIAGAIETQLPELFTESYLLQVEAARQKIVERNGKVER
jgi:hypothetical protein